MNLHQSATAEYAAARRDLLDAERQIRDASERAAALRRALPLGPVVDPATPLTELSGAPTTLGALFGGHDALLSYNMMFDDSWDAVCSMCAMWVDGLNSQADRLAESAAVAVLAPAGAGRLAELAGARGWNRIPIVSTKPSDLTDQLGLRPPETGSLEPAITVYRREQGAVRIHWHGGAGLYDPTANDGTAQWYQPPGGGDPRGIDPYCVTWGLLDLLPAGRGDWYPT